MTSFPYYQQFGSYVGGAGTFLDDEYHYGTSFFTDSANNLYVNGSTNFINGYTAAYYGQFSINGGGLPTMQVSDRYAAKFSSSGAILSGGYAGNSLGSINGLISNRLLGIDGFDNKYYVTNQVGNIVNLATAGVWLTADNTINASGNNTITLSKYNNVGNLLWTTYLPRISGEGFSLRFDENQNVYIIAATRENIPNIGTPGTFQENFIPYIATNNQAGGNGYLVKLNSAGQKVWGTFSLASFYDFEYYNGEIYTSNGYDANIPGLQTTPNTFQPNNLTKSLLMKFNATTGQQVWGTFYGTPIHANNYDLGIFDIAVNSNGLFVSGQTEDTAYPNYFGTTGAFKTQLIGGGDLFLSKFDFSGNRIWSTYFGSSGYDAILGGGNLTIYGNRIVISGNQYGNSSNISTPGAFLTAPSNTSNNLHSMFFAEFDGITGSRTWASYFGGPGFSPLGEYIHPEFLNDGSLILWGMTGAQTGIGTEEGAFPTMINPSPGISFGFITRFDFRDKLGTTEVGNAKDLILYDNPNNGNFTLSGNILEKEQCSLKIYDLSGRLFFQQELTKNKSQQLNLQNLLIGGNYLVEIRDKEKHKLKIFKMIVK